MQLPIFIKQLSQAFIDLVYPPLCLHCKSLRQPGFTLFCETCQNALQILSPDEHCPYCFTPEIEGKSSPCYKCIKQKPEFISAAVFSYSDSAASLVRQLKYGNQPYLAKGAGAYMAAQLLNLDWPMPDLIVPVPIAFTRWITRGYNQSRLLADSIGHILNVPVDDLLKRKSGGFSQAGLSHVQRMNMDGSLIELKTGKLFQNKKILLIDDVFTTGTTAHKCVQALLEGYPTSVYCLTLCKTYEMLTATSSA